VGASHGEPIIGSVIGLEDEEPLQSLFRPRPRRIMRAQAKPNASSAEGPAGKVGKKKLGE
jgi:hypothetical protein